MDKDPKEKKKNGWTSTLSYLGWIIGLFVCMLLARLFLIESFHISTASMETALHRGDYVLVNKWHTKSNPGRNRAILFTSPLLKDTLQPPLFVSRNVGMPGDTIQVTEEGYHVNGQTIPFSPSSLWSYEASQDISDSFIRAIQAPRRNWQVNDTVIRTDLTLFEEFQLREELTPLENPLFKREIIRSYKLIIPRKERIYWLDEFNLPLCRDAILKETKGAAVIKENTLFIDGKRQDYFFFENDYYWLLSDHSNEGIDSRHLGIIPEGNIIGNIWFCWYSQSKEHFFKPIY